MQGFIFERGPTIFKVFKEHTICIGLCKCALKNVLSLFPPSIFPEFVPQTEFKGRPEDTKLNVLYHTALRNYAAISRQVPSILSILLEPTPLKITTWQLTHRDAKMHIYTISWL